MWRLKRRQDRIIVLCLVALLPPASEAWFGYRLVADDEVPLTPPSPVEHTFKPIPGAVVDALCTWEVRQTVKPNRIPSVITEIYCKNEGSKCGANSMYECHQLNSELNVAYTKKVTASNHRNSSMSEESSQSCLDAEVIVHKRTIIVGVGCACFQSSPRRIDHFVDLIMEKRQQEERSSPHKKKESPWRKFKSSLKNKRFD